MERYYIFLDESETHTGFDRRFFCIAGIIIKQKDYPKLCEMLDNLKIAVWGKKGATQYILHEKDIKFANNRSNRHQLHRISNEYHIFRSNEKTRAIYSGVANIINQLDVKVIGSCINVDELSVYFPGAMAADKYIVAVQILSESYCHFLDTHDGIGTMFYESRQENQDREIRMRVNHIKALGSLFISPYVMQKRLKELYFFDKKANWAGLQIADFIPNAFARKFAGKDYRIFNMYKYLRKKRYDGNIPNAARFGVKLIP